MVSLLTDFINSCKFFTSCILSFAHLYCVSLITQKLLPYPFLWSGDIPVGIWPMMLLYMGSWYIIYRIDKKFYFSKYLTIR
jgi:hypothetical protein